MNHEMVTDGRIQILQQVNADQAARIQRLLAHIADVREENDRLKCEIKQLRKELGR